MKTFILIVTLLGLALAGGNTCETKAVMAACSHEKAEVVAAYKRNDTNFFADMAKNAASQDFKACKAAYSGC